MNDHSERLRATSAAYGAYAQQYADKPDDREWLLPLVAKFAAMLPQGARVVDIGCASGRETVELQAAGLRIVGLDITPEFLRIARARYPTDGYVLADATNLPFAPASFDGVWAMASLLHLSSQAVDQALLEIRRIVRPGGAFYSSMQIGNTAAMVPGQCVRADVYYAFHEPAQWRGRLEAAGFAIIDLDANEFSPEQTACFCNKGGRGWINAYARVLA